MEVHTWREKTADGTMFYRACHHANQWILERQPKVSRSVEEVAWERLEFSKEDWMTLRELLWRKYQRKRCPWRFIEAIDKLLEDEYSEAEVDDKE